MEKALNLWIEDMNRKHVLIDGRKLCLKALSLCEDFLKESPERSDIKLFTATKGWLRRLRNRFELRKQKKLMERLCLSVKKCCQIAGRVEEQFFNFD